MPQTYLLTWNPDRFAWPKLRSLVEELRQRGSAHGGWSTGTRKQAALGDRVFLMRQHREPRGLVGAGHIVGALVERPHWDPAKRAQGKNYFRAPIRWDALSEEPILTLDQCIERTGETSLWSSQGGGSEIKPKIAELLEAAWRGAPSQVTEPTEAKRPQPPANDLPRGDDLLDVETEVTALAESVALREAEPPLVVGVLGGWGSGKSFVLHLFEKRLREIRALQLREGGDSGEPFPYVGHTYVIRRRRSRRRRGFNTLSALASLAHAAMAGMATVWLAKMPRTRLRRSSVTSLAWRQMLRASWALGSTPRRRKMAAVSRTRASSFSCRP